MALRRRFVTAFGIALLALTDRVAAQEYSFRFYGPAEGLQNQVVLSLAQDLTGYLWVGTEGGLYRYDGTRFRLMGQAEELPCSTEVHSLLVASDGAVWANACAGIFRFDGRRFRRVEGIDRIFRGAELLAEGAGGSILISTPAGLFEASASDDGAFRVHPHPLPPTWANKPMHGILRQGSRVWFGCDRQLCLEEGGQVSTYGTEHGLPEEAWEGIQVTSDGAVWVRSAKTLYRRAAGDTGFLQQKPDIASSGFWGALSVSRDDSVLIPTDHGLVLHDGSAWIVVDRQRGLRNGNVTAAMEDREGSVWIGMGGKGLARWLGRGAWESWKTDQGLPSDIVWSIRRGRNGALWVGTALGLTRIDATGRMNTWTQRDGLGSNNVRWLAETSDGAIWAASKPGGLARIDPASGKIRLTSPNDGLPCDPEDVFVDRQKRLWLPTRCGLFVNEQPAKSNRIVRVDTPPSFGSSAWKVIEDREGTIWVSNGMAFWSLREGQWRQHRRSDGLLTDNPYVGVLAPDGSIWMRHRYDAGIDRMEVSQGRVVRATAVVSAEPKSPAGTAFHGFDSFGNFWRGTTSGVRVLHGNTWTTFTTEDGLVSNDCDGEAFWADADGSVWMGTSGGLEHYRSSNGIPPAPLTASPAIVTLDVDQKSRLIRAEFSSLNYKAEQVVHFAYQLDQGPWTETVDRNVFVSGLGPGAHQLRVRCRVRDGPPGAATAETKFLLEPRWSETWWLRLIAGMCLLGLLTQFVRWRLSAALQKHAELEATVATRTINLMKVNRSLDETARQLRRSEDRLKNAERLAHLGHWEWDVGGNHLSWSEEMFRIFKVAPKNTPTYDDFLRMAAADDRERLQQWINDCLARKNTGSIEFQIARADGESRIIHCTSEVSLDDDGSPTRLFGACQDITDTRRAQHEDFTRKRLESVGTLAGGIAHDFNNLLGAVLAQAELALARTGSGAYPEEELAAIRNIAVRGSEIVRQLLIYAGKDTEETGPVDISRIVGDMLELLNVSVSKRVTLMTNLGSDLPPVQGSASQIRQVVMNLVINASEAIGDRAGVIRVTTSRELRRRTAAAAETLAERQFVRLDVSDNGCGMSAEVKGRVFDPFFSTKGAGHGLGLAVTHGIVRDLQGAIDVTSAMGKGTTFAILLPCSKTDAETKRDFVSRGDTDLRQPDDTVVLVVEDEETLRQAVVRLLRKQGFTVLEAADGADAIEIVRAKAKPLDLVLLDMTIPRASSHTVMAEIEQFRPNVRVILTSAYSQEMLPAALKGLQICGFIRKPYTTSDLVQLLRKTAAS